MPKLIECRDCGKEVSGTADKCPHCGASLKAREKHIGGFIALAIFVAFMVWFVASKGGN